MPYASKDRANGHSGNGDIDVAAVLAGRKPVAWFGCTDHEKLAAIMHLAHERGQEVRRAPCVDYESYLVGRPSEVDRTQQILDLYRGRGEAFGVMFHWAFGRALGYPEEAVRLDFVR